MIILLKKIYILVIKILSLVFTRHMIAKYLKNNEIKKLHVGAGNRKSFHLTTIYLIIYLVNI